MIDLRHGATNLAIQQILAGRERPAIDQRAMLATVVPGRLI